MADRAKAVGTASGDQFVKDYLDVIKTDYDLFEIKQKKED